MAYKIPERPSGGIYNALNDGAICENSINQINRWRLRFRLRYRICFILVASNVEKHERVIDYFNQDHLRTLSKPSGTAAGIESRGDTFGEYASQLTSGKDIEESRVGVSMGRGKICRQPQVHQTTVISPPNVGGKIRVLMPPSGDSYDTLTGG